jgi:transcriptional regulator with XRE-family HTH domain
MCAFIQVSSMAKGVRLREFCHANKIDPGNYSKLERGLFPPPQKKETLERYATALGLARGSSEWIEFFDLAIVARGEIPPEMLTDDEVIGKLPVLFRTLKGSRITSEKLDDLVNRIKQS